MSVTGFTEQLNDRARVEARRHRLIATANRAGWPELERRNLHFEPFGVVIHEPGGDSYRINRGVIDAEFSATAAYFIDERGDPTFLEPLPGARR